MPAPCPPPAPPGQPHLRCAKLENNPSVFLVEARDLRDWAAAREMLADSRPADFDPALVTGFTVSAGGRSITLHRLEGAGVEARWEIPVAPGSTATRRREADARIVGRFLDGLARLRAQRRAPTAPGEPAPPAVAPAPAPATPCSVAGSRFAASTVVNLRPLYSRRLFITKSSTDEYRKSTSTSKIRNKIA